MINEYYKLNNMCSEYSYNPENPERVEKSNQLFARMKEIENQLREPGVVYYFIDSAIHGTTEVMNESKRCWINNSDFNYNGPNFYHFITKSNSDKFYKYFTYPTHELPTGYQPPEFKKLVHFKDTDSLGMMVSSHFSSVEQTERKYRNYCNQVGIPIN